MLVLRSNYCLFLESLFLSCFGGWLFATELPHHDLSVTLQPGSGFLRVEDVVTFPADFKTRELIFQLHRDLAVTTTSAGVNLERLQASRDSRAGLLPIERYRLSWQDALPNQQLALQYSGKIQHSIEQEPEEYAKSFSSTPGLISEQGVFLAGSSRWVPEFEAWEHLTFDLRVELPATFDVVSQGHRVRHETVNGTRSVHWSEENPMEEVYLIAALFHEYRREAGSVTAFAFLRQADPKLAARYLETTAQYIEMYSRLLGPYPYSKFALVENFWETGSGCLPSPYLAQQ